MFRVNVLMVITALLGSIFTAEGGVDDIRKTFNFNQGWRFKRVETGQASVESPAKDEWANIRESAFDDTGWELVNLPHSVRLEPWNGSGGQNFRGLCYYRKHFIVQESWRGKKLCLDFGGAMQVAEVWINNSNVLTHYGGYLPFVVDVTDSVCYGTDNVVAVRLDNSNQPLVPPGKPQESLDFAYFGGLYRDVKMIVADRLHVTDPLLSNKPGGGGIFVTYPKVGVEEAVVQVKTEIANEHATGKVCRVVQDLMDSRGVSVASAASVESLGGETDHTFVQSLQVAKPNLWHPNHPTLYTLRTRVLDGHQMVDEVSTRIGIRTFKFQVDGFYINGERFFSYGFNHHQDYLYLGYAVPDSAQYRDVKKLREAGMTSFRSHYPHAPAFMDACDELGVLTIVSTPGWQWFPADPIFQERAHQNTREMIRLNRNRPSVILWESGLNETAYTIEYAQTAQRITHEEFPYEPCYSSGDGYLDWQKTDWQKTGPVWDVLYNDSARPPRRPLWWREFGESGDMNWSDQVTDNRVNRGLGEAAMLLQARCHLQALKEVMEADPPVTGGGLWTGIDCDRGYHPVPFLGGVLDKARLPKFSYYMFASQRRADIHVPGLDDGPMVQIASLLNRFSSRDVLVFCNCEEVRLLRSYGNRPFETVGSQNIVPLGKLSHAPAAFANAFSKMDGLRLKAQGLVNGRVVVEQILGAAGAPRRLALSLDKCGRELTADGSDVILVHASIEDKDGNVVPAYDCNVHFSVSGAAEVVGDSSIEANPVRSELGIATALIRSFPTPGKISVRASAQGLAAGELELESLPLQDPVVNGRDVGRFGEHAENRNVAEWSTQTPAQVPDAKVMAEQLRSQEVRDGRQGPAHE